MKTDFVIDISPPVPYLAKFWFASYVPKCSRPIRFQDSLKRNIPRKKGIMKLIFVIQINIEVFYRLILSFCVCIAGLAQSIQNKKFAYLCNISRNTWAMKLLFLFADKYKSSRQVDSITLIVQSQVTRHAQITQNNKFTISLQYLTKEAGEEIDFLHAEEHEGFL